MGNKESIFCGESNFSKSRTVYSDEHVTYAACHMKGWRQFMEDASIHLNNFPDNNSYLFGVFDGHGGPEVAQYVQRHFSLELYLNPRFQQQLYDQALIENFNKMDYIMQTEAGLKQIDSIIRHNITHNNRYDLISEDFAGCTANVCLVTPGEVYVANAGDSRCVASSRGRAVALSFDHKPDEKNEHNRIKKAGGFVSRGRVNHALNISRSLGDLQFKRNRSLKAHQQMVTSTPDLIKCKREGLQFILLGCDGIWERKTNEEMVEWVRRRLQRKKSPADILEQLFDEQLAPHEDEYYGTDNMSAILILLKK